MINFKEIYLESILISWKFKWLFSQCLDRRYPDRFYLHMQITEGFPEPSVLTL